MALLVLLSSTGCGTVRSSDEVCGTYEALNHQGKAILILNRNLTYEQRIFQDDPRQELVRKGTWSFDPAEGSVTIKGGFNVDMDNLARSGDSNLSIRKYSGTIHLLGGHPDEDFHYTKKQ